MDEPRGLRSPAESAIQDLFLAALDGPMMADPRVVRDIVRKKTDVRYKEPSNTPLCERCRLLRVESADDMFCPKCVAKERYQEDLARVGRKVERPLGMDRPWQVRWSEEKQRWLLTTPDDFNSAESANLFAEQLQQSTNNIGSAHNIDPETIEVVITPPISPEFVQLGMTLGTPANGANANGNAFDRAAMEQAMANLNQQRYVVPVAHPAMARDFEQLQRIEDAVREHALNHSIHFSRIPGQEMADAMDREARRTAVRAAIESDRLRGALISLPDAVVRNQAARASLGMDEAVIRQFVNGSQIRVEPIPSDPVRGSGAELINIDDRDDEDDAWEDEDSE